MSEIYQIIDDLCKAKGISGYRLCGDLGLSRSTLTELRKGRAKSLRIETAAKIADYLGVSIDYLLGESKTEEKEKAPTLTKKDERDIAKDLETIRQSLENEESLMFDGDPMTPEARESILAAMKLGLEAAKARNKELYTPKKYKKE